MQIIILTFSMQDISKNKRVFQRAFLKVCNLNFANLDLETDQYRLTFNI